MKVLLVFIHFELWLLVMILTKRWRKNYLLALTWCIPLYLQWMLLFIKIYVMSCGAWMTILPLGYERVYLPLCKVADTPFHIQGDELCDKGWGKWKILRLCISNDMFCNQCTHWFLLGLDYPLHCIEMYIIMIWWGNATLIAVFHYHASTVPQT